MAFECPMFRFGTNTSESVFVLTSSFESVESDTDYTITLDYSFVRESHIKCLLKASSTSDAQSSTATTDV